MTQRTINRAAMWSALRRDVNAVKGTSATSASEMNRCSSSSQIAFGYRIGVHADSGMPEIAVVTAVFILMVIENLAPARRAAAMTSWV